MTTAFKDALLIINSGIFNAADWQGFKRASDIAAHPVMSNVLNVQAVAAEIADIMFIEQKG